MEEINPEAPATEKATLKTFVVTREQRAKILKSEGNKSVTQNECYFCDLCQTKFKSLKNLTKHMEVQHNEIRTITCRLCDKEFSSERSYQVHLKTVHSEQKSGYNCTEKSCKKTFKTNSALLSHMRHVHKTREARYVCKTCGKKFKWPSQLRVHSKVHSKSNVRNRSVNEGKEVVLDSSPTLTMDGNSQKNINDDIVGLTTETDTSPFCTLCRQMLNDLINHFQLEHKKGRKNLL